MRIKTNMEKFLITQKGVAGTTAADTIHHHDENDNVTIVTDESFPLLFHGSAERVYWRMTEGGNADNPTLDVVSEICRIF
ncbi:hypothetical protein BuS5_03318 [Desulfosarcina sp. BuS5]|uniref:hypothetical protein n=1 Tax=Desulfosarcina sp. BuS5 TaxID=933262 RepID=UPI00048066AD|nr:hypothetical protein [Desulfosarcina sp. BuS5]WDN90347.1 hypothetical protein BuS5_03318 [Desulfosarcina sp. BuS5]